MMETCIKFGHEPCVLKEVKSPLTHSPPPIVFAQPNCTSPSFPDHHSLNFPYQPLPVVPAAHPPCSKVSSLAAGKGYV